MVFKAVQTYESGEVVRWIEQAAEGADEPEHPAPVLALTAAQAAQDTSTSAAEPSGDTAPVAATGVENNTGTWLGGAALAVSLVAAVLAGLALRRRNTP